MMDYVGMKEIAKRHIPERWTKDVRDILPQHLAANRSFTCRSLTLYLQAMQLVRIGDSSVATYELGLGRMKEIIMEASLLA